MKKLHFKKGKLSVVGIIVMAFFVFMALSLIFNGIMFGIFFLFPAVVVFAIKEGVYIDMEKRMYKSYLSVFGISPAKWKPIPDGTIVGIKVLKLVARRAAGPIVLNSVGEESTKELYMYLPHPARVVLRTSDNVKSLYEDAQYIRQHMGFEVVVDNRIPEEKYL
jgi:hypothetical protein